MYYVVQEGEHLAGIAKRYGFLDINQIYDHAENDALRKKRPDANQLLAGDRLFIPDLASRDLDAPTGKVNPFSKKSPHLELVVRFKGADGKALAKVKGLLTVGDKRFPVTTNGDGELKEIVPLEATEVLFRIPAMGRTWRLQVGDLDPIKDEAGDVVLTGVKARLNNLGYDAGPLSDEMTDRTRSAVRDFQGEVFPKKEPTGELDQATIAELKKRYGC